MNTVRIFNTDTDTVESNLLIIETEGLFVQLKELISTQGNIAFNFYEDYAETNNTNWAGMVEQYITKGLMYEQKKIDVIWAKIKEKITQIFEDKNIPRIQKYKFFHHHSLTIPSHILYLFHNILQFNYWKWHKFLEFDDFVNTHKAIENLKQELTDLVTDLDQKKDNLGLPPVIYDETIDEKLENLNSYSKKQLGLLTNQDLSLHQRVEYFQDLSIRSKAIDEEIHIDIIEKLTVQYYDSENLKGIKLFFEKITAHYSKRVENLHAMLKIILESGTFGNQDRHNLKTDVDKYLDYLKQNSKNLNDHLEKIIKITTEKEKQIKEEQIIKDLIAKVKNAFDKKQYFPKGKQIVYENNECWRVGEKLTAQQLTLKEPSLPEFNEVKMVYAVKDIVIEEQTNYVDVLATIEYKNFSDSFVIRMLNFTTKEMIDREIEQQRLKEEKEAKDIITKVKNAFKKRQYFPEGKEIFNDNDEYWKHGDIVTKEQLTLEEPYISEMQLVKMTYKVSGVTIHEHENYVDILATISYKKFSDNFNIRLFNFTTKEMSERNKIKKFLKKFKKEYQTSKTTIYAFEFTENNQYDKYDLGIEEPERNFDGEVEYIIDYADYEEGLLIVKVKASNSYYSDTLEIKVKGFKKALFIEVSTFIKNYDSKDRALDLDYKYSLYNKWADLVNYLKDLMINDHMDDDFINALDWSMHDSQGYWLSLNSLIITTNKKPNNVMEKFTVKIKGREIGTFDIYFKNLKEKSEIINKYSDDNDENYIKVEIGPTYDEQSKEKDFVIFPHLGTMGGWTQLTHAFKEIVFKTIDLAVDRQGTDIRTVLKDKKITIDHNKIEELGKKHNLWNDSYDDPIPMQKASVDVTIQFNDAGDLIARFYVWGKVKWQFRGETISIRVKQIEIH